MQEITVEEALSKVSKESIDKLRELIHPAPVINTCQKMNNDIIMNALCKAVSDNVIKPESLDDKIIKLLNSQTNTISAKKVGEILRTVRKSQDALCCVVTLESGDFMDTINKWVFTGPTVSFNGIFEFVIKHFDISPSVIRVKMTEKYKTTIVNNIAQLVARYTQIEDAEERNKIKISITTISRLVNMSDGILLAEFKEIS